MTARQPRRTRRRTPAASLPRPTGLEGDGAAGASTSSARHPTLHRREHHVTKDYSHVKRDLVTGFVITVIALGFIAAMTLILA